MPLPNVLVDAVHRRARYRCEYCQVYGWPLTVDHVLPRLLGGGDNPENLSAACYPCNRLKSARISAEDPLAGQVMPLFNPRRDSWDQHFAWSADFMNIHGVTGVGRATAALLQFQRTDRRRKRQLLRASTRGGGLPWP